MKNPSRILLTVLLSNLFLPLTVHAAQGDLELLPSSIKFSPSYITEGRKTRIYATIKNNSNEDLYGTVRFANSGQQVGGDQPISVFAGRTDDVFVDWTPSAGEQAISVAIVPWQKGDNESNNAYQVKVDVVADLDHDGTRDEEDTDVDGDTVLNSNDGFPRDKTESKDTDGDGIGDNADLNDDNDGVPDKEDIFPLDPKESKDTDGDGIGDNSDPDIDGDGIPNDEEGKIGTDPKSADTDGDKVNDQKDAFPTNATETKDTNKNGIGDNSDPDIDGDGIPNVKDAFPANRPPEAQDIGTPLIMQVGETLRLDASKSMDKDGKVSKVVWIIDGKDRYEGISREVIVASTGTHEVELQVTDNSGETTSKKWNFYGTSSIFLTQGGVLAALIALALLGFFYYSTRASKKAAKLKQS